MPINNIKYLDQEGLKFLWSKISMEDYPNNDTLIAVINAIDENKADKSTTEALQKAINILNGTENGSVKNTVAEAIASIIANAPEDFDTLKEIATWIENDTLGTADLLDRLSAAEKSIEALDVQADWKQTDEISKDYIKNKPDENDALTLLVEIGFIDPIAATDGAIFTDSNGAIYTL